MNVLLSAAHHYRLLLACALGAVSVLAYAPFYFYPLSILSLAGLLYCWHKAVSAKEAFVLGLSYGLGLYCVGIYWIYISLHEFGGMPWWFAGFATFCLCAFIALFVGLVGYCSKRLGFITLSAPIWWGLSDWVRSWIFTGFPWLTLGYSQVPHSPLAGYVPVVGVYGVSVITALVAALLSTIVSILVLHYAQKHTDQHASVKHALTAKTITQPPANNSLILQLTSNKSHLTSAIIGLVVLISVGGLLKLVRWTSPIGNPIQAILIQGNIAQDSKWSSSTIQHTIDTYLTMVKQSSAQLIVLPETALPVVSNTLAPDIANALIAHAKSNNGNILLGMVESKPDSNQYLNSAFSFGAAPTQQYAKNHLVPFGEYIPLKQVFGWIYRDWLTMPLSDLARGGTQQKPMQLGNQQVAVNICYEDVFGEEIIRQLPQATLLVNMSNDAWYGQSFAASQHMQFSQARALETGRMVLRATNTGATAAIDSHGYVLAHAPHDVQVSLNVQAQGYTGVTPYVRWGNWPFISASGALLLYLICLLYWRRVARPRLSAREKPHL